MLLSTQISQKLQKKKRAGHNLQCEIVKYEQLNRNINFPPFLQHTHEGCKISFSLCPSPDTHKPPLDQTKIQQHSTRGREFKYSLL
jgi:hypothetical protein